MCYKCYMIGRDNNYSIVAVVTTKHLDVMIFKITLVDLKFFREIIFNNLIDKFTFQIDVKPTYKYTYKYMKMLKSSKKNGLVRLLLSFFN